MAVDDGAKKAPRAALSVDVQHAQDLKESHSAVTNTRLLQIRYDTIRYDGLVRPKADE